jgi:hypothetical protein
MRSWAAMPKLAWMRAKAIASRFDKVRCRGLEHRAEKCEPVFGKKRCANKWIEQASDSNISLLALVCELPPGIT